MLQFDDLGTERGLVPAGVELPRHLLEQVGPVPPDELGSREVGVRDRQGRGIEQQHHVQAAVDHVLEDLDLQVAIFHDLGEFRDLCREPTEARTVAGQLLEVLPEDVRQGLHHREVVVGEFLARFVVDAAQRPEHLAVRRADRHAHVRGDPPVGDVGHPWLGVGVTDHEGCVGGQDVLTVGVSQRHAAAGLDAERRGGRPGRRDEDLLGRCELRQVGGIHRQSASGGLQEELDGTPGAGVVDLVSGGLSHRVLPTAVLRCGAM